MLTTQDLAFFQTILPPKHALNSYFGLGHICFCLILTVKAQYIYTLHCDLHVEKL